MHRIFLVSLLVSFLFSCASEARESDYLLRYEEGEQYGYKTPEGEIVIPAGKYDMCFTDTFRTYAVVVKEGAAFIGIDRSEKELYEVFAYDNGPDDPSEGLFRIVKNGKIGFADAQTGAVRIAPEFLCADRFRYGVAAVSYDCRVIKEDEYTSYTSGDWSYIGTNGKPVATTKGKTYAKTVIEERVSALNKLLKNKKLKEVFYPNMSSCGGALHGYYQDEQLHYIEANYGGGLGDTHRNRKIWLKDSSVVKIVISESTADMEAFAKRYPDKEPGENPNLLTYITNETTIWFTDPVTIVQSPQATGEDVFTEEALQEMLDCIEEMIIELRSTPYVLKEMERSDE